LESYAQVFDEEGALANLETFASLNGPAFYNLPVNSRQITLQRRDHLVPELVNGLVPFHAGEILSWAVADASDQVQL
jgi:dihydroorotase